ncbi:cytochrome C [Sphingomonas sp. MA1305]|uniref:c-type cytochrome n=1 Tax=Sphingomonas sp. MA1305 TaxID=2479204 RepID=UPI0018DFC502|nr:c-type cytochrome [Sphingomonas sp. MA1305]MBI0475761.1 cytochrome C [Sphingomonas sp. MA1305]
MPASLKWLGVLFAAAVLAAMAAGGIMFAQGRTRTRIMADQVSDGSNRAGREAMAAYGCGSCHVIPGIAGATGQVGPDLGKVAVRATIAGKFPNDPATMARWLRHPQAMIPGSAMPEQGVTERDARDMTAYLYTLK